LARKKTKDVTGGGKKKAGGRDLWSKTIPGTGGRDLWKRELPVSRKTGGSRVKG